MLKDFRKKIAYFISPDLRDVENTVNQRVAQTLSKMNILDYLLKDFHGTFSTEYERPEDKLNERSSLSLKMFGYQQNKDPNFEYLSDWIMNSFGNETLKRGAVTSERLLYGRAQISSMILWKKEIERLSLLYEDLLEKNKVQNFNKHSAVE
jgi:hypothetical protein